ncbi:hypothetical protein PIB30_073776 [Stylosanthes scabra]|uniref:Uncharacterized protein n=1 Tax=Stylosanthes scabra TaxID=79078 RepID=A0ABU6VNI2_9FABA|nr:hypothetical protein [Stylosanthes scabra]
MRTNLEKGRPLFHGFLKSDYGASSSSQVDPEEPVLLRTAPPSPHFRLTREREPAEASGDHYRNVCIIPVSAHSTNPISTVMCGMKIISVGNDAKGNINIPELRKATATHEENLSALMVGLTSPLEQMFVISISIRHFASLIEEVALVPTGGIPGQQTLNHLVPSLLHLGD